MAISHDVILIAYGLATAIGVTVAAIVWRHRAKTGAVPLALVLVGSIFVSGPRFVATAIDSYTISVLMERLLYVGIGLSVLAGVLLVLEYTGREHLVTKKTVALLSIEPSLAVFFAFANPSNLFFESIEPDPSVPTGVAVDWGIAFGLHTVYSYLLMVAVTAMILEFLYNSRALYRGQAAALLGAAILPWLANAVHVVGPVTVDTTPLGYIILGSLYAFAIVRYQLIDVVPIARDRVLDSVSEGVFVVDREDRLIDVNPAGRRMLDIDPDASIVGHDIHSLFETEPEIIDLFHGLTATTATESSAELAYSGRYFEVQASPITDGRDRHVGWLALVYDITDRRCRTAELEHHNERLDEFASLVSHDLRNPLTVASGYLELARETDDNEAHLDQIEAAHDRMETLIEDVLLLAREGETVTDSVPVSLEAIAERAWRNVDTGSASLSVETGMTIRADPDRVQRALENLFRNAVEHSSTSPDSQARQDAVEHGSTSTASQAQQDAVEHGSTSPDSLAVSVGPIDDDSTEGFYVADNGVGIPSDHHERVFEDGFSFDEDGTGFGLSVVSEIARAHDWSVEATESDDGGARFEFTGIELASNPPRPN